MISQDTIDQIDLAMIKYDEEHDEPPLVGLAIPTLKLLQLSKDLGFSLEQLEEWFEHKNNEHNDDPYCDFYDELCDDEEEDWI